MPDKDKKSITSFKGLEVYQNSYKTCTKVMTPIIPNLPESEKYDLKRQLSESVKAIPRLIAEGYAKRHQRQGFQKYLDDAMAECNETIVGMEMCKDFFGKYVDTKLCEELVSIYDVCGRQLYRLRAAWGKFPREKSLRSKG
ncbi:MAG: four helix bundle protein [Syntrophaceae bacterium]|nr:four helix bundle protein [Syntrophaceae bacterium]